MTLARWRGTVEQSNAGAQPAGTWFAHPLGPHPTRDEQLVDGERAVIWVRCPECSRVMTLSPRVHSIAADGALSPSLVCANGACTWHVFERLADWRPA